jgi:hypothetical protein
VTTREILLTLHIVFVAGWLGADIVQYAIVPRLDRDAPEVERGWARHALFLHQRYYPTVAMLVLISGVLLVLDGPWKWSSGFIWVGVGAIVLAAALGGGGLGGLAKKRSDALEAGDTATAAEIKRRAFPLSLAVTAIPIIAILAMVDKWQAAI